jgi:hypothetical protein
MGSFNYSRSSPKCKEKKKLENNVDIHFNKTTNFKFLQPTILFELT